MRYDELFSSVEGAAEFLSEYFSTPGAGGRACCRCPCSHRCRMSDMYCEEVIAEWLEASSS